MAQTEEKTTISQITVSAESSRRNSDEGACGLTGLMAAEKKQIDNLFDGFANPPKSWDDVKLGSFVNVLNGSMHYLHWGVPPSQSDTVVLLVHGIGNYSYSWTQLGPALEAEGYSVLAPDLFGRGRSRMPPNTEHTADAYVEQLDSFLSAAGVGTTQKIVLVGHSMGGGIATAFSAHFPAKIQKLVLMSPAGMMPKGPVPLLRCLCCCWRGLQRPILRKMGKANDKVFQQGFHDYKKTREIYEWTLAHQKLLQQHIDSIDAFIGSVVQFPLYGLDSTIDSMVRTGSGFSAPVLLLWGKSDTQVPYSNHVKWVNKFKTQNVPFAFKAFDESGHVFFHEKVTEFTHTMIQFLNE